MNFQNLLNQFTGSNTNSSSPHNTTKSSGLSSGLMGGAAAGGIMALLVGNKSARKFAGKAATFGGAALIGGIAFKAYKGWQQNNQSQSPQSTNPGIHNTADQMAPTSISPDFQLTLMKAMIAAAKADGHIDEVEQKRIFDAIEQMALSSEIKGLVFDLLRQPIYVEELAHGAQNMEQKSEVYLASCLAIDLDSPSEYTYLAKLASALSLPLDLAEQIKFQAKQALNSDRVLN
jgi:uncharacterized membrane protein YebE (DUF533 family)